MRARGKKKEAEADVDLVAFADIAFLLIIFFVLTTTFVQTAGRRMEIPAGTTEPSETKQKQLTINLTRDAITYGEKNREMTLDTLRLALAEEKLRERPLEQRMVILDSKQEVPYGRYFKVVMAITDAGGILALIDESE